MIFVDLFFTFFWIGLFTIGGGYAMLSLIQNQVVTEHAWLTDRQFTDIVGVSQMTPGPIGINSATYIGYSVVKEAGFNEFLSILGSCTASFAVILPSFLIVLAMVKAYDRFKGNHIFATLMYWLKPAVIGLIASAAIILISPENFPEMSSWIIFAAAFLLSYYAKMSPIAVIVLAGAAGYFIG